MIQDLLFAPIRQILPDEQVDDVAAAVREGLAALPLNERLQPGMRVALALGSRGISCQAEVVQTLAEELRRLPVDFFIVPAMGSHGGGTAEGQRALLESSGLGAPVRSSLEVVQVGTTPAGMPVFTAADVLDADAIILVNRIKEHTSFSASLESGLLKMLAVGLGKARGAAEIHARGIVEAMPAAARVLLEKLPVSFGIAIVENGRHSAARIAVIRSEDLFNEEPCLLDEARRLAPRIPLEPLDLLVLQEIGKDISGTGMDLKVVGMWRRNGGPVEPLFRRIAALDLTPHSRGSAVGMGFADLITRRLLDKVDLPATYLNCLTAQNLPAAKIPLTLESDRAVFEAALSALALSEARVLIAKNTLELEYFWASSALLPDVHAHPLIEPVGPLRPLSFDESGSLTLPSPNWPAP